MDNKIISTILLIFIILYTTMAAPKLTEKTAKIFNSIYIKILFILLIAFLAYHDPIIALIAAIALFVSLQTIRNYETSHYAVKSIANMNLNDIEQKNINTFSLTNKIPKTSDIITDSNNQIKDSEKIVLNNINDTNIKEQQQNIIANQNTKIDAANKINDLTIKIIDAQKSNNIDLIEKLKKEINKQTIKIDSVQKLESTVSLINIAKNNSDTEKINKLNEIINNQRLKIDAINKSEILLNQSNEKVNIKDFKTANELLNQSLMNEYKADAINKYEIHSEAALHEIQSGNIEMSKFHDQESKKFEIIKNALIKLDNLDEQLLHISDMTIKKKIILESNKQKLIAISLIKSDIYKNIANNSNNLTEKKKYMDQYNKQLMLIDSLTKSDLMKKNSDIALVNGNEKDSNEKLKLAELYDKKTYSILNSGNLLDNAIIASNNGDIKKANEIMNNINDENHKISLIEKCEKHYNESKNAELLGEMELAKKHMEMFNKLECNINQIMDSKKPKVNGFVFNDPSNILADVNFSSLNLTNEVLFETKAYQQEPYIKSKHEKLGLIHGFTPTSDDYAEINTNDHSKVSVPDYVNSIKSSSQDQIYKNINSTELMTEVNKCNLSLNEEKYNYIKTPYTMTPYNITNTISSNLQKNDVIASDNDNNFASYDNLLLYDNLASI